MTPEGLIKKQICQWLELKGCRPRVIQSVGIAGRKNNSRWSCRGMSDVFTSWQKRPLFIEVKAPGKKPTLEQVQFIEWAREQGWLAFVAHSLEEVIREIEGKK
jgi:hypothetical protein